MLLTLWTLFAIACSVDGVDLYEAYSGVPGLPTCFRQPVFTMINATHYLAFAEGRDNGYRHDLFNSREG